MVAQFALNRRFSPPPAIEELPPHNIEAEEAILGGCLLDPGAFQRCKNEGLESQMFYVQLNQRLFCIFEELSEQNQPTDFTTVSAFFQEEKARGDTIGGQSRLIQLLDRAPHAVNIDQHSRLVIEKWCRRELIEQTRKISEAAQSASYEEIQTIKHEINAQVESLNALLSGERLPKGKDFRRLAKQLRDLEEDDSPYRDFEYKRLAKEWGFSGLREMKAYHARWLMSSEKPQAYTLDEYEKLCAEIKFDWILPGFIPRQSVMCTYAPGGTGKTWFIFSILRSLVEGKSWGGFSPESPVKVLCIETDQGRRQNNRMLDLQSYFQLPLHLKKNITMIDEKWSISNNGYLRQILRSHRPDIVLIDSLTSVSAGSIVSENDAPFAIPLIHWREMANEFNCSFMVIHHANKGSSGSRGGAMRGTSAIYNACDEVWKLEPKNPQNPKDGTIWEIEKSRSRDLAKFLIQRDPETDEWVPTRELVGDEELELTSPTQQQIVAFLSQTGEKYESEDLAHALNLSPNTIRKELGRLSSSGIIGMKKGGRRRAVYFAHHCNSDPADPDLIQESGSGGSAPSETAKSPEQQALQPLSAFKKKSPDPTDPPDPQKKTDLKRGVKKEEKCGSVGSGGSDDPQTQSETDIPPDPDLRISSGSVRISSDHQSLKPGDRVWIDREEGDYADPVYICESAGIKDKKGRTQGWQILQIDSHHYHCKLAGSSERRVIGKMEVRRADLRYPDWVYEPVGE